MKRHCLQSPRETVRIHRGDADLMKGAGHSGLHLPCRRLYTGSKAAGSFLGPGPGQRASAPRTSGPWAQHATFAAGVSPHC